jgi:hypothetical protein
MPQNGTGFGFFMPIANVSQPTAAAPHQTPRVGDAPANTASVALVPVVTAPRRPVAAAHGLTRPDAPFVAHLIAMAESSPQTRMLRRAAPADVQAAYRSVANQNQPLTPPGARMRRVA